MADAQEMDPMYGRRASDNLPAEPSAQVTPTSEYVNKVLYGAVTIVMAGTAYLIKDTGSKVDRLTEKIGSFGEIVAGVVVKQTSADERIDRVERKLDNHIDEDRKINLEYKTRVRASK